jgi:predicted ester cyclase
MLQKHSAAVLAVLALAGVTFAGMTALTAQTAGVSTALLDRYVAALNNHDLNAFAEVIADKYVQHNGRAGQGLAGTQATFKRYFETFPDMHVQVEDTIVGSDKLVARVTLTATHANPVQLGPGTPTFPPTGKKLSWSDIEIWRVADGKFVEHWDQSDLLGLARQLRGD